MSNFSFVFLVIFPFRVARAYHWKGDEIHEKMPNSKDVPEKD